MTMAGAGADTADDLEEVNERAEKRQRHEEAGAESCCRDTRC